MKPFRFWMTKWTRVTRLASSLTSESGRGVIHVGASKDQMDFSFISRKKLRKTINVFPRAACGDLIPFREGSPT
jgi:hypothetical protein